jgi:putative glutamine transport system substrate-binding protein
MRSLNRRALLALATGVALLAAAPASAGAADRLDEVKARGKLLSSVWKDGRPFSALDDKGEPSGFDVDIARELAKALFGDPGKVEFVQVTPASRFEDLRGGKVDLLFTTTILPERAETMDFSQPYFMSGHVLLVRKDSPLTRVEEFNGKTAIIVPGTSGAKYTAELAPGAKRLQVADPGEGIRALKEGRADGWLGDDIYFLTLAKKEPELKVTGLPPVKPGPYGIAAQKGSPQLLAVVNEELARMQRDGTYDRLLQQWFGDMADKLLRVPAAGGAAASGAAPAGAQPGASPK